MRRDIGVIEMAFAFWRAPFAKGKERRQPAIGGAILGIGEEAGAVAQIEAHADDEADANVLGRLMRADKAGDAVAVGNGDRLETKQSRLPDQLVGMRPAVQKREIAGRLQLGVIPSGIEGKAAIATGCLRPLLAL
jgi:hypothetical protein